MKRQTALTLTASVLSIAALVGCSSKRSAIAGAQQTTTGAQPQGFGTVSGNAQVALQSGDVKPIAFATVRMVQQDYQVLTPSEKDAIEYDANQGLEAEQLGVTSTADVSEKTSAKVDAMKDFEAHLPEKQAIPAVATTTSDGNGNFTFEHLPTGTYWICINTKVGINWVGWSVRVEVNSNAVSTISLNNTDVDYAFN